MSLLAIVLFAKVILFANDLAQNLYEKGINNFQRGKYAVAADYLGQSADMDSNNVWARFYYVWAIANLGKRQEAQRWLPYLKSVSNTPQYKELVDYLNRSGIYKKHDEEVISKANSPEWAKPRQQAPRKEKNKNIIEQAKEYIESENPKEATKILKKYLKKHPSSSNAYKLLGIIEFNAYNYDKCIDYFGKAFLYGIEDFDSYFMMAQAYLNIQKEEEALYYYKKASLIKENDTFVRLAIADIYRKRADYANAEETYKDILNQDSKVTDASVGLAEISYEQGYLDKALKQVELILVGAPDCAKALFLKAKIYMENKDYEQAAEIAKKAYENNPSNMEYESFSALTLIRSSQTDMAIEILNEILERRPDNVYALDALAEAYIMLDKNKDAEKTLLKAESFDKIAQTCYLQGLLYVMEGSIDKAKPYYEEYKKRSGGLPRALLEYATFLEAANETKAAEEVYDGIQLKHKNTPFAVIAQERSKELKEFSPISKPVYFKPLPDF